MSRRVEIQLNPEQAPAQGGIFDRAQRQPAGRGQGRGQGSKQGAGQHRKQQHRQGAQAPKRPHGETGAGPLRFHSTTDDQQRADASLGSAQTEIPDAKRSRPELASEQPDGQLTAHEATPRQPRQAKDLASRLGKFSHILDESQSAAVAVAASKGQQKSTQATPRTSAPPSHSPAATTSNGAPATTPKAGALGVVKSLDEILLEKRMLQGNSAASAPPASASTVPSVPQSSAAHASQTQQLSAPALTVRPAQTDTATLSTAANRSAEPRADAPVVAAPSPVASASKPIGTPLMTSSTYYGHLALFCTVLMP
jgi:hypothetical protein